MKRTVSQARKRSVLATLGLLIAAGWALLPACSPDTPEKAAARPAGEFTWPVGPRPKVTLHIAQHGDIEISLYPELAPKTVENFIKLAETDVYRGTTFHRVIPGFMIQGGDPNSKDSDPRNDGQGGQDYPIPDEFSKAPHIRGVVAMANTGGRDSAGSQFFIVQKEEVPRLDGLHAIFGRVSSGMEVVDAITQVEIDKYGRWGPKDRPIGDVVIERVTVTRAEQAARATPAAPVGEAGDPAHEVDARG